MSINMRNDENSLTDTEAYQETVASQEEIYLEVTEEELRAVLTSDAIANKTTAQCWEKQREELELGWMKRDP